MTLKEAQQYLKTRLLTVYEEREAANIADWVMEKVTGQKKIDRLMHKDQPLSETSLATLNNYTDQLIQHKPVQYVLHEAWFYGMQLYVDENVLIPRPETEELVEWIIQEVKEREQQGKKQQEIQLLDIGTGSGCIPVALKKQLPGVSVNACDVSAGALSVAKRNAQQQQTAIQFSELDFLNTLQWSQLPTVDIIVSNPPYIPQSDEHTMNTNVLAYEPHLALFVPDNDALLFYRHIADFGLVHLRSNGKIFIEIHEDLGAAVCELYKAKGYSNIVLRKDMQGKDRMVMAVM